VSCSPSCSGASCRVVPYRQDGFLGCLHLDLETPCSICKPATDTLPHNAVMQCQTADTKTSYRMLKGLACRHVSGESLGTLLAIPCQLKAGLEKYDRDYRTHLSCLSGRTSRKSRNHARRKDSMQSNSPTCREPSALALGGQGRVSEVVDKLHCRCNLAATAEVDKAILRMPAFGPGAA
jgi:hypothetical protein